MDTKAETLYQGECSENAHHWIINDRSLGVCKKCGAKKQFPVYVESWRRQKVVTGKSKAL